MRWPRRSKHGKGHEQQVGVDGLGVRQRLAEPHRSGTGQIAGAPLAEHQRGAARDGDRQRGAKAVRRKRDEQRQRVGFVADRQKRRNDVGLDAPREGDALFGEARRER